MAPDEERSLPSDDTVVADQSGPIGDEEITQADGEWPVADMYYVEPDGAPREEQVLPAEDAEAASGVPPDRSTRRPLVPSFDLGLLLAAITVAAVLAAGAAFLLLGDGEPAASSTPPTAPLQTESSSPETTTQPPADSRVAVADVEGMPLSEARKALEAQSLRVRVTQSPSERDPGVVLDQEPPADSKVAEGTVVALVVSDGTTAAPQQVNERVEVPDVVGMSASTAVARLREAGLAARVRTVSSSERPGVVVGQSPRGGAEVAKDAVVQLEVAKARPRVLRIEVPDVVGATVASARGELRAAGFRVSTISAPSQEPAGTVIRQSPRAGSEGRKGATVKLTVSSGPEELDVPDVTGLDEGSARARLERAGFEVQVTDESTSDPNQDGMVLRQTPQGGSSAEKGAIVTITVGRLD